MAVDRPAANAALRIDLDRGSPLVQEAAAIAFNLQVGHWENGTLTRANSQANHVCTHCSLCEPAALAITNTELDEMGRMVEV